MKLDALSCDGLAGSPHELDNRGYLSEARYCLYFGTMTVTRECYAAFLEIDEYSALVGGQQLRDQAMQVTRAILATTVSTHVIAFGRLSHK